MSVEILESKHLVPHAFRDGYNSHIDNWLTSFHSSFTLHSLYWHHIFQQVFQNLLTPFERANVCFDHAEQKWAYLIKFPLYFEKLFDKINKISLISSALKISCLDDVCAGNFLTNLMNQMKNLWQRHHNLQSADL